MSDDPATLESRIAGLTARLTDVERRLSDLEGRGLGAPRAAEPVGSASVGGAVGAAAAESSAEQPWSHEIVPLIGRTLVVLGGAFALRAITEAGVVPRVAGTALGIAYAVLWIVLADRAAGKRKWTAAGFHALAAAIIVYPLLWEATINIEFLSPLASALALAGITGIALFVAARRGLRTMAWVFSLAAIASAVALAVATKTLILFVTLLLVLGLATLILGYLRQWYGLAWFVAVVVDLSVVMLTTVVIAGGAERVQGVVRPGSLVVLQLALVLIYLGAFFTRTLLAQESVSMPAMLQGIAAVVVGIGGAIAVTQATAVYDIPLGLVSLVLALGSYGASFTFIDRALQRRGSFIFYTTLALLFTVVACGVLFEGWPRGLAFAFVGLLTTWLGATRKRATLSLHGAVYVVAGATSLRLFESVWEAFVGPQTMGPGWISLPTIVVLAIAAVCGWFSVATHGKTWGRFSRVPKLAFLLVLLLGAGGIVVTLIATVLPPGEQAAIDVAALATLRTGVLAVSALFVAGLGRWSRAAEAAWLVYPLLAAGGLKMLTEDIRFGRPVTLFISFALYGGALIIAPRMARGKRPS